jgi:signal transduction histidine kinase
MKNRGPKFDPVHSRAWIWVSVVLFFVLAFMAWASLPVDMPNAVTFTQASVQSGEGTVLGKTRKVTLPHTWSEEQQRDILGGQLNYHLMWPQPEHPVFKSQGDAGWALLIPRAGARFRVLIDGVVIESAYWDTPGYVDTGVVPHWVALPSDLDVTKAHDLQIQVRGLILRKSGLGTVTLGDAEKIRDRYDRIQWWQVYLTWMVAACSGMLALLTGLVWLTGKERVFALLSIASFAWMLRLGLTPVINPPMSFGWWFFIHKLSFTVHCGFLYLFLWELFDLRQFRLHAAVRIMLWVSPLWIAIIWWSGNYNGYRIWTALFAIIAVISISLMVLRGRNGLAPNQRLILVVSVVTLITGLRDFFVVQFGLLGDAELRWMTPGSLVFMLTLSLVLVQRMNVYVHEIGNLNAVLQTRVLEKEKELREAFERIRETENQKVLIAERARLTRDMHDGLGSQLVQTLNAVRGGKVLSSDAVETMLTHALEELRMTLDSMEPMEGDLPTILGTLRRRITPALESANIDLHWDVQEVPALLDTQSKPLEAKAVMHLFRCLQEVFANIIKHAKASQITVHTRFGDQGVVLSVTDNGRGLGAGFREGGRGLNNIRMRAGMIGASVAWVDRLPGTEVRFLFTHFSTG